MSVATMIREEKDSEVPEITGAQDEMTPAGEEGVESRPWGEFPPGWTDFRAALRRYRQSMER